jgi:hypothetical protein
MLFAWYQLKVHIKYGRNNETNEMFAVFFLRNREITRITVEPPVSGSNSGTGTLRCKGSI